MGDTVLQVSGAADDGHGYLRTYAHCNRNGSGITLLLINIAQNTTFILEPAWSADGLTPRLEYVLTAEVVEDNQFERLSVGSWRRFCAASVVAKDGPVIQQC